MDQELNRIERLKREQKHANDVFTKMSNAFAAAAVRSEIEKVDSVEEVKQSHRPLQSSLTTLPSLKMASAWTTTRNTVGNVRQHCE